MFKSHFLKGDTEKKSFFKKYTNKLTKIKALSKKLYFSSEINNNQNDPRKLWKVMRSAFPSTNRSTVSPQSLQIDSRSTEDSQLVSNHFNEFFCTIGANLANKFVNNKSNSFVKHLKHRISPSIYLDTPSPIEIRSAIYSLSLNKAVGYDNISPFFLRSASTVITPFLHLFINFCFNHGVFPENFVTAKLVPICKKGNHEDPSNYRSYISSYLLF